MKRLTACFNALVTGALVWCAVALVARYRLDRAPSVAIATAVALAVTVAMLVAGMRIRDPVSGPAARRVRDALLLGSGERRIEFFRELFGLQADTKAVDGGFETTLDGKRVLVTDEMRFEPLTADTVAKKILAGTPSAVLCTDATPEARELARAYGVTLYDLPALYDLMRTYRAYPRVQSVPKPKRANVLSALLFDAARTKGYLIGAFVLIVSSLWSGLRVYYLSVALLLCALAVVCAVRRSRGG